MTRKPSGVEITINGHAHALRALPERVAWIARCRRCRRWYFAAFVLDDELTRAQMEQAQAAEGERPVKVSTAVGYRTVLTEPTCKCRTRHLRKVEDSE